MDDFWDKLKTYTNLCIKQLHERFVYQSQKNPQQSLSFYMAKVLGQEWRNVKTQHEKLEEILKQGTLSVGFVGLAEALVQLFGLHHGESQEAFKWLGYKFIKYMRDRMDEATKEYHGLNFTLLATPAESFAGKALREKSKRQPIWGDKRCYRCKILHQ